MALSRSRGWLVAVVATLAMSVSYVDRQVLAAIATSVREALHFDALQFGWLAGAFSASYLVAAPLSGWLIDRIGARRGLAASVVLWSCVSAAHALVPTFAALLLLRILLGVAEAPSFPGAAQTVRRVLPPSDRATGYGILFTGSSFGAAVAGPLAVWLNVKFGWQAAFLVTALLGTLWIPLWLAVCGDASVREALAAPDSHSISRPRADAPPRTSLLLDPALLRAVVLVFAAAPAIMFALVWLPQYLELARRVPRASLGHYLWLPPLMTDAGMLGFGLLASWRDARSSGPRSHRVLVLMAAALDASLALVPRMPGTWAAVLVVGIACAGGGGLYTLFMGDMVARIHPEHVAMASGLTAAAQSLVYVVLNPVVGGWIERSHSFDGPLVLLGVVAIPGALAWVTWPMRGPLLTQ
jgi:ACS family hexuronate transporter-like MFS transporter